MFLNLITFIAYIYGFAWFLWPFIVVYGFAFGLIDLIKGENKSKGLIWASIALLIITCGLFVE